MAQGPLYGAPAEEIGILRASDHENAGEYVGGQDNTGWVSQRMKKGTTQLQPADQSGVTRECFLHF